MKTLFITALVLIGLVLVGLVAINFFRAKHGHGLDEPKD